MFSCFNICVFYLKSTDLFNVVVNTLSPVKYLYSFLMFFISHVLSSAGLRTDPPGSLQRPLGLSACGGRRAEALLGGVDDVDDVCENEV